MMDGKWKREDGRGIYCGVGRYHSTLYLSLFNSKF